MVSSYTASKYTLYIMHSIYKHRRMSLSIWYRFQTLERSQEKEREREREREKENSVQRNKLWGRVTWELRFQAQALIRSILTLIVERYTFFLKNTIRNTIERSSGIQINCGRGKMTIRPFIAYSSIKSILIDIEKSYNVIQWAFVTLNFTECNYDE